MLSRGGAVAFQKVVAKVSDLPSPLDAEAGTRIIVRETEEVYGLNGITRMWEVIGTVKKVGGKKPEEIAAHIDEGGNPHGTSLQNVLDVGTVVKVSQEIVLNGKGPASQIRIMSGSAALRVGPDAGSKDGVLWFNVGSGKKTILRAVNADGDDMLVLSTDGVVSGGSATFYGGFKGLATFEDEIIASEGVQSAESHDLVLSGDKGVVLSVKGQPKAYLASDRLNLSTGLGVKGDLILEGAVRSSLSPAPALEGLTLGNDKARWAAAAVGDLDVTGQVVVHIPANSKTPPLLVSGSAPAHSVVITPLGELGLGTNTPERRLDVCGGVIVGRGESRLGLDERGLTCGGWAVSPGPNDSFSVARSGSALLTVTERETTLHGDTKVSGDLTVGGKLCLGGVSGLGGQNIEFQKTYTSYDASWHDFAGGVRIKSDEPRPFAVGEALVVDSGDLLGKGSIKGWKSAEFSDRLVVAGTMLTSASVHCADEFIVNAPALAATNLRLIGGAPKLSVTNDLVFEGTGGKVHFGLGGPNCGMLFEGKHWAIDGIDKLSSGAIATDNLKVSGDSEFCGGAAVLNKQGLRLAGGLSVNGLGFKKVEEDLELTGEGTPTKLTIPAGVRVEAVVVTLKDSVTGARFLQVGDMNNADRFASPNTNLRAGSIIRGLNHCDRGQSVQKAPGPVVISGDAPASGKVHVTVYYVDPVAL